MMRWSVFAALVLLLCSCCRLATATVPATSGLRGGGDDAITVSSRKKRNRSAQLHYPTDEQPTWITVDPTTTSTKPIPSISDTLILQGIVGRYGSKWLSLVVTLAMVAAYSAAFAENSRFRNQGPFKRREGGAAEENGAMNNNKDEETKIITPQEEYERHAARVEMYLGVTETAMQWRQTLKRRSVVFAVVLVTVTTLLFGLGVAYASWMFYLVHLLGVVELKYSNKTLGVGLSIFALCAVLVDHFCGPWVLFWFSWAVHVMIVVFVKCAGTVQERVKLGKNFEKRANFLETVREVSDRILGASAGATAAVAMTTLSTTLLGAPPADGFYVSPKTATSQNGGGNENATYLSFVPCRSSGGVSGWWIRGFCMNGERVKSQDGSNLGYIFHIGEGFVSTAGEAFWVQNYVQSNDLTLFTGRYDPKRQAFKCQTLTMSSGEGSDHVLVQVAATDVRTHYCFICDGCGASPIQGTRYRGKNNQNFDLCEDCMKHYDQLAEERLQSDDDEKTPFPAKDDFDAFVKPPQNPFPRFSAAYVPPTQENACAQQQSDGNGDIEMSASQGPETTKLLKEQW